MSKPTVIINGTPRENGNTDAILNKIIEGAHEVGLETIYVKLRELAIANCIGCCTCRDESQCHFQDDMTQIRRYIEESDLLIFASTTIHFVKLLRKKAFLHPYFPLQFIYNILDYSGSNGERCKYWI